MPTYSESFAGGATTANTLLTLAPTTGWQVPPGQYTIVRARIGYANIVNAKESSGFLVIQLSGGTTWAFAYGGGTGAATNGGQMQAEDIDMSIPIGTGTLVTVKVITSEVHNDTRVSLMYIEGQGPTCMTLAGGGAGQDLTAGTELTLAVNSGLAPVTLTPYRDGRIIQMRIAGGGLVDALSQAMRITIQVPGLPEQFEFIAMSGPGGAATALGCKADVISNLDIPVKANSTLTVKALTTVTTGGAVQSVAVSFLVV